jgi:hypothetical protein
MYFADDTVTRDFYIRRACGEDNIAIDIRRTATDILFMPILTILYIFVAQRNGLTSDFE